jgi:hypothetical protein
MRALWLCLCLGLAACAETGTKPWYRADGAPSAPGQVETDKVACEQEMKKPQATRAAGLDRDIVQADAYDKCMTRLGYTDSKMRASAPPGTAPLGAPAGAVAGAPPGAPVRAPAGAVAGGPPGAPAGAPPTGDQPSPDCRKVTDLRMWLPLCP